MSSDSSSFGSSSSLTKNINDTQRKLQDNFAKLASGKRINKSSDDAAGLAIADALQADAVVLKQGSRNTDDSQSAAAIADSALSQVSEISGRLQELATQSANGTLSDDQRSALNGEFQALTQEAQRIGATTEFNGQQLLTGNSVTTQVGTDGSSSSQISSPGVDVQGLLSSLGSSAIDSIDGARNALGAVQDFASNIESARSNLGASSSRLDVASSNNESQRTNSIAAESRIRDADIASSSADNVSLQIRQQVDTALSAQANLASGRVLDLLK